MKRINMSGLSFYCPESGIAKISANRWNAWREDRVGAGPYESDHGTVVVRGYDYRGNVILKVENLK